MRKVEPGNIRDWASTCAEHIAEEVQAGHRATGQSYPSIARIAAIIATFADPLISLLHESRREHYHCDDSWFCCGRCVHPDHCPEGDDDWLSSHDGEAARQSGVCNCGADAWNARVEAALK